MKEFGFELNALYLLLTAKNSVVETLSVLVFAELFSSTYFEALHTLSAKNPASFDNLFCQFKNNKNRLMKHFKVCAEKLT